MSDFTATDFKRVPGRRFENIKTGQIISRRQYDKHFGILAKQGFTGYETKSAANKKANLEAILRPARGRKKFVSVAQSPTEKAVETYKEIQTRNKVAEQNLKTKRINQKVSSKLKRSGRRKSFRTQSFGMETRFKKIYVGFSREAVDEMLAKIRTENRDVEAYMIGAWGIDTEDGSRFGFNILGLRDIRTGHGFEKLRDQDWDEILATIIEKMSHYKKGGLLIQGLYIDIKLFNSVSDRRKAKAKKARKLKAYPKGN